MARGRDNAPDGKKRRARDKIKPVSMRKCIVTGEEAPKSDLVRFVVGPDGVVFPDLEARLPGRGLWVKAARDVIETARKKKAFARAARSQADAPEDLADQLESQLVARCVGLLGMARKSGSVVSGYEKVRAYLLEDRAGLLMAAREGAIGGRRKLRNCAPELKEWALLDGAELAQALGREAVVHVAVARGPLADRLAGECRRLDGFRSDPDAPDEV